MSLESRLTKLEILLQPKKEYPTYISLTSEEYKQLEDPNTPQEVKETICVKHKILGLKKGVKTYIDISPDDWGETVPKFYVGVELDKV